MVDGGVVLTVAFSSARHVIKKNVGEKRGEMGRSLVMIHRQAIE